MVFGERASFHAIQFGQSKIGYIIFNAAPNQVLIIRFGLFLIAFHRVGFAGMKISQPLIGPLRPKHLRCLAQKIRTVQPGTIIQRFTRNRIVFRGIPEREITLVGLNGQRRILFLRGQPCQRKQGETQQICVLDRLLIHFQRPRGVSGSFQRASLHQNKRQGLVYLRLFRLESLKHYGSRTEIS